MADTVLLQKPEHSVCLGLILQGLFWMKGLIFKQRIFNILGFLPKLMIFQKFLRATISKIEGCAFLF